MLKIKDNVDLKELEKFGFEHKEETEEELEYYLYENETEHSYEYAQVYVYNRKIDACDLDKIYDLIKADLVEKVWLNDMC